MRLTWLAIFLSTFTVGVRLCDDWPESNWFYAVLTGVFGLLTALVTAYGTARFNAKFKGEDEK